MQRQTCIAALLLTLATGVWAQQPQKLEPLPDVPPPPNTLDVESKEPRWSSPPARRAKTPSRNTG